MSDHLPRSGSSRKVGTALRAVPDCPPLPVPRNVAGRSPRRVLPNAVSLVRVLLGLLLLPTFAGAQESKRPAVGSIQLSFLPPPLEKATYSLGVFDAKSNKLVRRLQEAALEKDFTVGLNGLIATWDGKDDNGKPVPPGRYAARGYAVGPLKIEGEDIQGNDWAADDETLRITHVAAIALLPGDAGLAVLATLADGSSCLVRFMPDGKRVWRQPVNGLSPEEKPWLEVSAPNVSVLPARPARDGTPVVAVGTFQIDDGTVSKLRVMTVVEKVAALPPLPPGAVEVVPRPAAEFSPAISDPGLSVRSGVGNPSPRPERGGVPPVADSRVQRSPGKDGTAWTAAGLLGLVQSAADRTVLRKLEVLPGDPLPVAVSASATEDRLYLLEEKAGWQRVRGLSWVETKEEDGHPVSTWQTFFERNIRAHDPAPGAEDAPVEISLAENPLSPGKPPKAKLTATHDAKGSYLTLSNGLRLRRISERPNLQTAKLTKGKTAGTLSFFQSDAAATDEFSIAGVRNLMEFDAGEFEMTATGEKPADPKTAEPPDL